MSNKRGCHPRKTGWKVPRPSRMRSPPSYLPAVPPEAPALEATGIEATQRLPGTATVTHRLSQPHNVHVQGILPNSSQ